MLLEIPFPNIGETAMQRYILEKLKKSMKTETVEINETAEETFAVLR